MSEFRDASLPTLVEYSSAPSLQAIEGRIKTVHRPGAKNELVKGKTVYTVQCVDGREMTRVVAIGSGEDDVPQYRKRMSVVIEFYPPAGVWGIKGRTIGADRDGFHSGDKIQEDRDRGTYDRSNAAGHRFSQHRGITTLRVAAEQELLEDDKDQSGDLGKIRTLENLPAALEGPLYQVLTGSLYPIIQGAIIQGRAANMTKLAGLSAFGCSGARVLYDVASKGGYAEQAGIARKLTETIIYNVRLATRIYQVLYETRDLDTKLPDIAVIRDSLIRSIEDGFPAMLVELFTSAVRTGKPAWKSASQMAVIGARSTLMPLVTQTIMNILQ